jgi:hypothetical protein
MATIMNSRTYQASSTPTRANKIDAQFFSHYPVRRLPAEEMMDAVAQVTGVPDRFATYPLGTRAIELSDIELPSLSLDTFGRPPRVMPIDSARCNAPSREFVFLQYSAWDHHAKIFEACDKMLRPFEQAVAALLRDLKDRGLLDHTLVAMNGDFGRTSKINKDDGRDHWGNAGSMLFAGAGVRDGQVIGTTDERGEYVLDRPVHPPEIAATIYDALGIDYTRALMTPQGRPVRILPDTEPIKELYG